MIDDLFATASIYSAPHKTITKMEYCIKESSHYKREGSRYNFWRFPVSDERCFAALRMTVRKPVILSAAKHLSRSRPAVLTPVTLGTYIVYMLNEFSSFM